MIVGCFVKMLNILTLCPVLLVAVQTLTIDSQLGTSIEDCFERLSIGEQVPRDAIYRNVTELTTRECEQLCKQDKQCQTYDYGVGAKGNATCNLSNVSEKELKEKNLLLRHPDYDVYVRRFQCEQSPPSPLQGPQFDDPGDGPGPAHRPVFRPDEEDPRRPVDDYDSRPFETIRPDLLKPIPPYRPPHHNYLDNDRPDDYNSQKPVFDAPPSYGAHKPQDIPYKPLRPEHLPYKPNRPPSQSYKPDSYDQLHFQEPYKPMRPLDPGYWRPDPYHPPHLDDPIDPYGQKPMIPPINDFHDPYGLEKPTYHYIVRPNRKPRPEHDTGYGVKPIYYPTKPDPGYGISHPIAPVPPPDYHRPINDYPSRPYEKPSYNYNSNYASNYGQSSYNDNSIYVEIYDPPRPFKPPKKPLNDRPSYGSGQGGYGQNYGYGQQGDSYGSSQSSESSYGQSQSSQSHYSQGTITEIDNHDQGYNRPQTGGYGSDSSYGSQSSGYGSQNQKPTKKPSHQSDQGSYGGSQASYGGTQSYGNRPSYGTNQDTPGYGETTQKPSDVTQKPYGGSFGGSQGSYGGSQGSYGSNQGSYADSSQGYGNQGSYNDAQGSYGNKPALPGYIEHHDSHSSHDSNSQYYGTSQESYGPSKPIYNEKPIDNRPSYGGNRPSYDDRPPYGDNRPLNKPSYGNRPAYDNDGPYGNDRPLYDNKPSYGDKPSHNKPAYEKPSYNNDRPYSDNRPLYDDNRPDPGYNRPDENQDSGYGSQTNFERPRPNQTGSTRPHVKPVYEYELEKPNNVPSYIVRPGGEVITSRPVSVGDYGGRPAYGRDPGHEVSYKACFRRVLAGKRALRSFVRKVVPCERLEDCRRECATERRFPCESFNYRLDPSFRGKGLCEMMTKPIEAFDLRRDFVEDKDYDFYEVDRNSLEPYCPELLQGAGVLHSGFLSSKPDRLPGYQNQWSDRVDVYDNRYGGYNRYNEEGRRNQRRRYQDRFYVPYQIGIGRSNDADIENWGTYGGSYGGNDNYYKDRNDYHKSVNYWRLPNAIDRPTGVKPGHNRDFDYYSLGKESSLTDRYGYGAWKRGRWNSSGTSNGLDYGESNYYKKPKPFYETADREDDIAVKDCSSRRRPGMSLGSGAIRRSLLARNVVECEAACFGEREFKCVSYSYRYSSSRGTDNCFLSERPYRGLELSADSGSDVYAMPQHQGCTTGSQRPWVESECFWHVRSGAAVSGPAVRAALTVAGLGACEAECIRAHAFFCRGFSFRYDAPTIGDDIENCILTSSPPTSLEAGRGLRPTAGHELYARGNYGRGCEPALYDDLHHREKECYLQYDNAAKLIGAAVRGRARVPSEPACGDACTEAPFRCLSFSYNNNAPPGVENCYLSEIRLFDLQRGVDYEHSAGDWLFAFDLFNGQCWRKVHGKTDFEEPSAELPRPLTGPGGPYPGSSPSGPGYLPEPAEPPFIPESGPPSGPSYTGLEKPTYTAPSGPEITAPGYKPAYPVEPSGPDYKPGYLPEPSGPGYYPKPELTGFRPSEPSGPDYHGFKPGFRPSEPTGPGYNGFKPGFRPVEPSGNDYRPERYPGYRPEPSRPGYLPEPGYKPGFRPERPGYLPEPGYGPPVDPGYRPGERPHPDRPRPGRPGQADREDQTPISVSWRHYTVSGFPCRTGTTCAQNQVAGHWACEPEGGEVGSWDYCCAPTHRCGYSEGFHKPWCYVGTKEDQWRPCSEKYYPYHQHNVPHPSQGHKDDHRPPLPRPQDRPTYNPDRVDRPVGPYLSNTDKKYWDDLYKNGPQAYYDNYGNPLPGYTRVPTANRPYIKYRHNYPRPGSGTWVPQPLEESPVPGALGVPRYWPVAYLHKGPPPNMTYFKYNETRHSTTTENYPRTPIAPPREQPPPEFNRVTEKPKDTAEARSHRDEKTRNITNDDIFQIDLDKITSTTTSTTTNKPLPKEPEPKIEEEIVVNKSDVETVIPENVKAEKESEKIKGIDDKLVDFTGPIEVLDIEDIKTGEKISELKTLEAEERQIEAIGRLLASRRGSKLVLEKRSQKDLEAKSIAVDKDLVDFNFGNKFPTTDKRVGIIQKVSKDEIERERNADQSLEVSETTFVRPPRVLSTTENIRKAIINGKVFYDATIREQRDIYSNATRKSKTFRQLEDSRAPSVIANNNYGKKKVIKARNVNPVRRVRRVYRKRYNPEEVRRRLLERDRNMKNGNQ